MNSGFAMLRVVEPQPAYASRLARQYLELREVTVGIPELPIDAIGVVIQQTLDLHDTAPDLPLEVGIALALHKKVLGHYFLRKEPHEEDSVQHCECPGSQVTSPGLAPPLRRSLLAHHGLLAPRADRRSMVDEQGACHEAAAEKMKDDADLDKSSARR